MKTIWRILRGILVPTHVYLFLPRESCMIDEGIDISDIPLELQYHSEPRIVYSIINTDNIGPHRKLLPILQHYWD